MITVVSGLPRSGTSMLMQMLQAGGMPLLTDAARAADASNPRGYYEYAPVMALARDASWVSSADGQAVKVIAQLLTHLPPTYTYRVVFLERSLDEVLASQAKMLERLGRPAAPPQVLRPAFTAQLKRAKAWLAGQAHVEALYLQHADVLRDPASAAQVINTFLGGQLDEAAMAAVVDPTLHRERQAG